MLTLYAEAPTPRGGDHHVVGIAGTTRLVRRCQDSAGHVGLRNRCPIDVAEQLDIHVAAEVDREARHLANADVAADIEVVDVTGISDASHGFPLRLGARSNDSAEAREGCGSAVVVGASRGRVGVGPWRCVDRDGLSADGQ